MKKNYPEDKGSGQPETRAQQKPSVLCIAKFESWSLFPPQAEGNARKEAASYQAEEMIHLYSCLLRLA